MVLSCPSLFSPLYQNRELLGMNFGADWPLMQVRYSLPVARGVWPTRFVLDPAAPSAPPAVPPPQRGRLGGGNSFPTPRLSQRNTQTQRTGATAGRGGQPQDSRPPTVWQLTPIPHWRTMQLSIRSVMAKELGQWSSLKPPSLADRYKSCCPKQNIGNCNLHW